MEHYSINSIAFRNQAQNIISADEQQGLFWWNLELDNLLDKGCNKISSYLKYNNADVNNKEICNS